MLNYKQYVKVEFHKEFENICKKNCLDFYSCGCILTAHLVMEDLMRHKSKDDMMTKEDKCSPKEAWDSAMEQTDYHSGASAGMTASIISRFSPRGKEFQEWWNKECGSTGKEKGTINPAILRIKPEEKKK